MIGGMNKGLGDSAEAFRDGMRVRWREHVRELANKLLRPLNIAIVRRSALPHSAYAPTSYVLSPMPPGAESALRVDHPRLVELRSKYEAHPATAHSQWSSEFVKTNVDLRYFRGDNAYMWQLRSIGDEARYLLTAYHVREADDLGLMERLQEDGLFGAYTFDFNGKLVGRDLLDSILEINFLDRHFSLSRRPGVTLLDVGAGYGRLAYRLASALPEIGRIYCTDAVPESTYVCEYYLRFRGVADRAEVVPLDEIKHRLRTVQIDVATNIHSFSQCPLAVVEWWLDLLVRTNVRYFMLVLAENTGRPLTLERDGSRIDFMHAITSRGFKLMITERKYQGAPSLQRWGVAPETFLYLFERAL